MQNRQLQTWLSEDEYAQIEVEWQEQLELCEELKDKPNELQRYEETLNQATFCYNRAESYSSKGKNAIELAREAEVVDVLAEVREAAELGELDALIEQQAQFGRRVTQKNKWTNEQKNVYRLNTCFILHCASADDVNYWVSIVAQA